MQPNPTKSAQIQSKPLKAIQIFPDPSKYVAISTRIQRALPNPTKINLYLSSKSAAILSSQPKSTQIQPNRLKSAQIHTNSSNPQKVKQIHSDSPSQVHQILLNLSEPTPICQIVEIMKNLPRSIKTYQIHQNLCKSTRIVLNPAETTNIYPNKPKPNLIVQLQRNPFKYVSIHLHGTHRSSNHKIACFRQLHKQLQITQNSQHLIQEGSAAEAVAFKYNPAPLCRSSLSQIVQTAA